MRPLLCSGGARAAAQLESTQGHHKHPRSKYGRCACPWYCIAVIRPTSKRTCHQAVWTAESSHRNSCTAHIPLLSLTVPGIALADNDVAYNAGAQSEVLQTLGGVVYVGLVSYLLYKVFTRRAKRFTSEKLTSTDEQVQQEEEDPELTEPVSVTPIQVFFGAAQALGIAAALYICATKIDGFLLSSPLPEQYIVRNVAVTVRTIFRGLFYLATFIFAANGIGLSALAIKILIFGDDEVETSASKTPKVSGNIPKVGLTSNLDDVMRAFDEASDVSKYQKKQEDSK